MYNKEQLDDMKKLMKTQNGAYAMTCQIPRLANKAVPLRMLEIVTGEHIFILEKNSEDEMHFYHSSLGTGTRKAILSTELIDLSGYVNWILHWNPQEITLYAKSKINENHISSVMIKTNIKLRVVNNSIMQIGNEQIEVAECTIRTTDKSLLMPSAIENWNNLILAIEMLESGISSEGYMYETVKSNSIITMLVTGFEAYCKKRFIEIESEGGLPFLEDLCKRIFSKKNFEQEKIKYEEFAKTKSVTLLNEIANSKINFQNFDECKRAYSKTYKIVFGQLDVKNKDIESINKCIKYRHRIVHYSPFSAILNFERVPPEKPVFSNTEYVESILEVFNRFIQKLHDSTLEVKSLDTELVTNYD